MDTKEQKRADCRLASRLHDQISARRHEAADRLIWKLQTQATYAQRLDRLRHRLEVCKAHQFDLGIDSVRSQIRRVLPEMIEHLTHIQSLAEDRQAIVSCCDLAGELEQVRKEFGVFTYRPKEKTLSIETDSITLEDQYLGPFEIRLDLDALGQLEPRKAYRVVATDPHPAAGDENITHPHVSDERLCEGEATLSIRNALRSGRLGDFFLLVAGVLATYNSGSAYVSLNSWTGTTCDDCGAVIRHEDDVWICDRCGRDCCSDCVGRCDQCDTSVCKECTRDCTGCGKTICTRCALECGDCGDRFCQACLADGLCKSCREERQSTQESEGDHVQTTTVEMEPAAQDGRALPALDPSGLGQTPVSS